MTSPALTLEGKLGILTGSSVRKAAEKAEAAVIGRVKKSFPGYLADSVSDAYDWNTRERVQGDPGSEAKTERRQMLASTSARTVSRPGPDGLAIVVSGKRRHLPLAGLPFAKASQDSWRKGGTAYEAWRSIAYGAGAAAPYGIHGPRQAGSFGADKRRLFVYPSAVQGIPLLFRRGEDGKVDTVKQAALPEKARAKVARASWEPRLAELVRKRLDHETKRAFKPLGVKF